MLKTKVYILLLLFFCNSLLFAQINNIIDSSYTTTSAYNKAKKKYPFITVAKPLNNEKINKRFNVNYKVINGDSLYLDAFINSDKKTNPAVILVHGGGWTSGSKELLNPLAEQLATNGFNCFSLNYRLAPQSHYPESVADVYDAIDYIIAHAQEFNIHPNQIAILGCSSGAQLASLVAVTAHSTTFHKTTTPIKALVNIDGILAFSHQKSEEGTLAASWLGGTEEAHPELWKAGSALTYVNKDCPPTLFIPSHFERFQAGRDEMVDLLKQYNIYYEIQTLNQAPHTFWLFHPWFNDVVKYTTNFLNTVFKNTH